MQLVDRVASPGKPSAQCACRTKGPSFFVYNPSFFVYNPLFLAHPSAVACLPCINLAFWSVEMLSSETFKSAYYTQTGLFGMNALSEVIKF